MLLVQAWIIASPFTSEQTWNKKCISFKCPLNKGRFAENALSLVNLFILEKKSHLRLHCRSECWLFSPCGFVRSTRNPSLSSNVTDLVRSTTISNGNAKVHTIEHVLSALAGSGVDNVVIDLDASEPPIMDGSARPFANLILELSRWSKIGARIFRLPSPVSVPMKSVMIALPYNGLRITCTSTDRGKSCSASLLS